ncbi:hypothetical protein AGR3A_Cc170066 [Agrobacterium tomkonis CFBP 6623]|uniref:Uncharacterized protein n=1 Tax=Agrobacterium tomkonis CFBP 6623 TaxID=1183432 RepID=A0A1S7NTZ9_9HYPH|nr:hypothetical protein AGR3A_Cc170066 [Agrobacterium tomkonis CFBP 6623]
MRIFLIVQSYPESLQHIASPGRLITNGDCDRKSTGRICGNRADLSQSRNCRAAYRHQAIPLCTVERKISVLCRTQPSKARSTMASEATTARLARINFSGLETSAFIEPS